MSKLKRIFYDSLFVEKPIPYYTRKGWLRYKDKILNVNRYNFVNIDGFGIKLQPKHRHHRSVAIRNIRKIYGFTVADLAWKVELCEHENWLHGVAVEQSRKRRLYVYYY